ncbi:hypothetical protein ZYGR_0AD03560 [Zygosaccharomyces rouxii]|uniref:ATPase expression protein 2, mitochondrial n=2 Tax=Zygosaccharomyces rouxii TaxID=4956 RepID=AEP2_ZYGRC|nr:uncharacterized protein ZYRO0G14322g [Zygosaccharomyces rouxii]C5E0N8.1 RecName: Full=ATPase expression protein 2, mitochondrial; Flags: Precursor [Zygosaccharomyces rouxii CBS 732]KAH9202666.1 ATPase expression protein 2, mitochondrial [Zygosaccharomyces rouxii]GAV51173.1 hypothetical protein ZYGR_0AD03560 [Zygosaccharomyces rouxii]CAR29672.1 ZYRO0G14322p [Zygosaccharomyces rouxii]
MLRTACSRSHVFKAFSSSLMLEHALAAANSSGAAAPTNAASTGNSHDSTLKSELPLRTLNDELHNAERKYIKPLTNAPEWSSTRTGPNSKIREYLKNGQYTKLLIRLSVDNHLNNEYISGLFTTGGLTKSEYSLFINKLLSEEELDVKLSNVIPDTPHTELIYKLYEFYCDHIVDQHNLTPLQLYDLNLFLKTFIAEAQLSKAHNVLDFILLRRPLNDLLANTDVEILIQFLRLKCGALSKFWKIQPASQRNSTAITLGEKASDCHLAKSYKFQNEKVLLQIINSVLGEHNWKNRRSPKLDAAIIYSLGYLGQTDLIEKYVNRTWSPSKDEGVKTNPNSDLLVAVLTSYCVKEGNMRKGLEVLDRFIRDYPEVELDPLFWRRLLQLSSLLWDKKRDRKATLSHGCWTIMKQWHAQRQRKIPYDYGIMKELYPIFVRTKNKNGALEVITKSFFGAFIQPEFTIRPNELSLLCKYQRFILKMIALKGNYHKGFEFCQEWSFSSTNKFELQSYFMKWRGIHEQRRTSQSKQKAALQEKYDEMEEDDMLLGRLW